MIRSLLIAFVSSFVGTFWFAYLFKAPRKACTPAGIIGGIGYTLYFALVQYGFGEALSIFAGATLASVLAQVCARRMHMISTIFVSLSIVAMVPGVSLYRCMAELAAGNMMRGASIGVTAMVSFVMIALGLSIGSFACRLFWVVKARIRNAF